MQDFIQLTEPQFIVCTTLQVKVVNKDRHACYIDLGGESNSSPEPFLKRLQLRLEPARLPEVGMISKMNYTRIRNPPAREGCLTVVGRVGFRSLGQFNKLSPEDIIQTKLFGDFLSDINSVCTVSI